MNSKLFRKAIFVVVLTVALAGDPATNEHEPENANALSAQAPKEDDTAIKDAEIEDTGSGTHETAGDHEQETVQPNMGHISPQKSESLSNVPIMKAEEHPPDEPTADTNDEERSNANDEQAGHNEDHTKAKEPIEFLGENKTPEKALPEEDQESKTHEEDPEHKHMVISPEAHTGLRDENHTAAASQETNSESKPIDGDKSFANTASSTTELPDSASSVSATSPDSAPHEADHSNERHEASSENGTQKEVQEAIEGKSDDIQQEAGTSEQSLEAGPTESIVSNSTDHEHHTLPTTPEDPSSNAGASADAVSTEEASSTTSAAISSAPEDNSTKTAEVTTGDAVSDGGETELGTSSGNETLLNDTIESTTALSPKNATQDGSDASNEIGDTDDEKPGFDSMDSHNLTMVSFQKGENFACRIGQTCPNERSALQCQGALCTKANVTIITCHNKGSEDIKLVRTPRDSTANKSENSMNRYALPIHWACGSAELEPDFMVKNPRVICEGYRHPGDRWLLSDSCSLKYGLDRLNSSALQGSAETNHGFLTGTLILITCFGIALFVIKAVVARQRNGNWLPVYCAMPLKARMNFRRKRQNDEDEPVNVHFDMGEEQTTLRDRQVRTYGNEA